MKKFLPFVQITPAGERLAVMFDSACAEDTTRNPRVVFVPQSAMGLSLDVDGEGVPGSIQIKLLVVYDDVTKTHDLATISVPGGLSQSTVDSMRQAIASSFQTALASYLRQGQISSSSPVMTAFREVKPVGAIYGGDSAVFDGGMFSGVSEARKPARSGTLRSMASIAGLGVLGFAIVYGAIIVGGGTGQGGVIQAAVTENMGQDPASIMAQVELTKETLRQMGLDPGRAGDLGCLAPQ